MRFVNSIIACLMLGFMFVLMFFSSWNDSATFDEVAHIPAGYSYLTQGDYRLNPEHPPLIKDLAALPLLFLKLNFPIANPAWQTEVNGQWDMGRIFLYESGNNADQILHFTRFPIMLLALLFGWLLFGWVRKIYGDKVGLLTLFFYASSPTFLAHSRYVTTDLGAAFGFFIGIATFISFLQRQNKKNLIIAGIVLGIIETFKFSLILLAPLYVVLGILWVILENYREPEKIIGEGLKILGKIILIGAIGLSVIAIIYQFHIWNYPAERQANDISAILTSPAAQPFAKIVVSISNFTLEAAGSILYGISSALRSIFTPFGLQSLANFVVWISDKHIFQGLGEYLFGILMMLQRTAGGNSAYFMGEVSAAGWHYYFPLLYLLKEHLAFHIFTLIAIIFSIVNIVKAKRKNLAAVLEWCQGNFVLTAGAIFIAVYWAWSINSPLNIGVRHVLPTFPFIYFLVSRQIVRWSQTPSLNNPRTPIEWVKDACATFFKSFKKYAVVAVLCIWMVLAILIAFPHYLSYYNELAGGTSQGYKIATDSNYDWGQDLKRLVEFVNDNNIQKIAVDYFGGGNPQYYLGNKFEPWWSAKGPPAREAGQPPKDTWLAVSANSREGSMAKPVKGLTVKPEDTYSWLKDKIPVARAGTSIFIYKF